MKIDIISMTGEFVFSTTDTR